MRPTTWQPNYAIIGAFLASSAIVAGSLACSSTTDKPPATYEAALTSWSSIDDINGWIGKHFRYDMERAMALSESGRAKNPGQRVEIHPPDEFYAQPQGICVDLARFGYESIKQVAPDTRAHYLMIEFEPAEIRGEVLRRHWLVTYEKDGKLYSFADSKRPGHIAGPYDTLDALTRDYERFRGRTIVAAKQRDSYRKQKKRRERRQSAPGSN